MVSLSCGPTYSDIVVPVNMYKPANLDLFARPCLAEMADGQGYSFQLQYAPPLGLSMNKISGLRQQWQEYARITLESERNYGEVEQGETSRLVWQAHDAVRKYYQSTKVRIFHAE